MLKAMKVPVLLVLAALPALADSRFQIRHTNRDDAPLGKGQCDIRLQVDGEVEVSLRADTVMIHTLSGKDARDNGSECSTPMPARTLDGFTFEAKEGRNAARLVAEPSGSNGFAAVVRITDTANGASKYHFRLTWTMTSSDLRLDHTITQPDGGFGAHRGSEGFAWNNTVSFRGSGRGDAWMNDFGPVRLGEVNIEIDQSGKLLCWFKSDRGKGIQFNGNVVAREQNRWKADVMSEDRRYRGPLYFTVDAKGNVSGVSIEASDGRDRMQLSWDRR